MFILLLFANLFPKRFLIGGSSPFISNYFISK
jgi:hypothetical protein